MAFLADLFQFFFPRTCAVCGRRLTPAEGGLLCAACQLSFPYARPPYVPGSQLERRFWGKMPVVRAAALFRYHGGSDSAAPVLGLKYAHRPDLGYQMGRQLARQLLTTDFFSDIDVIVPVPLARVRQFVRGYNQSVAIARGLGDVAGLPVETRAVRRTVNNPSQTKYAAHRRAENVEGIFRVVRPRAVAGRHILLVDDVATTGATLASCGAELARQPGVRISVAVLGDAGGRR